MNCLSLNTVICKHGTVSCYTIWQTRAIVDTATHKKRSSSVVSRANTSHDNTAVTHEHPHTSTPSPSNSSDSSHSMTLLRHTVTLKISPVTRHRTDNNKHNDTTNLHAQSCCTHKLHTQTRPKISQNVYKSKRNLEANDVRYHTQNSL